MKKGEVALGQRRYCDSNWGGEMDVTFQYSFWDLISYRLYQIPRLRKYYILMGISIITAESLNIAGWPALNPDLPTKGFGVISLFFGAIAFFVCAEILILIINYLMNSTFRQIVHQTSKLSLLEAGIHTETL